MSTNTLVFGLFEYDAETDGNLPFNITQALNNNWDKIDSLVFPSAAAAAPYNPSGTYNVGDYCIYNGTLQICNTPIPSGETWNPAHWTNATLTQLLSPLGGATTAQAALAALGAGVRPNELDNACFVGGGTGWGVFPVNQRGKTSYSASENQNVFDRWKLVDNQASVELVEDGIIIRDSKEITGNKIALQQSLHNALYNDFFTMSCIIKEMKGSWFFACTSFALNVPVTVGINEAIIPKENAVLSGRDFYFFKASSGVDDYIKIQAVKIERGEGQTLAYEDVDGVHLLPQPDSDYATQNMRCRSYYRRYGYGLTAMVQNSILIFNIPFDVPMRVVPVCNVLQQNITMIGGDVAYPISISSTYVIGLGNGIEIICNVEFTGEVPQLGSVLRMNTPLADIFELSSEL